MAPQGLDPIVQVIQGDEEHVRSRDGWGTRPVPAPSQSVGESRGPGGLKEFPTGRSHDSLLDVGGGTMILNIRDYRGLGNQNLGGAGMSPRWETPTKRQNSPFTSVRAPPSTGADTVS